MLVRFPVFCHNCEKYLPIPPKVFDWMADGTYMTRQQIPLRRYATTIHKSQRQTLKKVVVDLGKGESVAGCTFNRLKVIDSIHRVLVMAPVMVKIALKLLIIFWLKKKIFCSANSVCYSFYGEEAVDLNQTLVCHLLWCYQQINSIHVGKKLDLQLSLLLSGDIELCPGPEDGYLLNNNPELGCLIKRHGLKCLHVNVQGLWNDISQPMAISIFLLLVKRIYKTNLKNYNKM